jgi:hypothetical protein
MLDKDQYFTATHGEGLQKTYTDLFGDPWADTTTHIPGSLQQPAFRLPFLPGKACAYTGVRTQAWGSSQPYAAIDFCPAQCGRRLLTHRRMGHRHGRRHHCAHRYRRAVLDLDGDQDERTGWVIIYLHLSTKTIPPVGNRAEGRRIPLDNPLAMAAPRLARMCISPANTTANGSPPTAPFPSTWKAGSQDGKVPTRDY